MRALGLKRRRPPPAATVVADVARLKSVVPTQSHTMIGRRLPLGQPVVRRPRRRTGRSRSIFFDEARQSIRWTVLIRPVRQRSNGGTVDVKGIFNAMDISAFATVQLAIEDQDEAEFVAAYKSTLEACHSCHVASEKPYLRPVIPTAPPSTLIDFNPTK